MPYASPGARSYFQYGLELSEQGFDVPALGAFEQVAKADPTAAAFFNLGTLYMKAGRTPQAETAFATGVVIQGALQCGGIEFGPQRFGEP